MFHFPEFPARSYLFTTHCPSFPQGGFPHSDICGSLPYHNSPQLFAVVHVLLRPLTPRHPPYALCSLTCSALQIGSPVFANKAASHTSSTYSSSSLSYSVLNVPNPLYFSLLHFSTAHFSTPDFLTLPTNGRSPYLTHPASDGKPLLLRLPATQWACVDSNHGPLRYQHSALTG